MNITSKPVSEIIKSKSIDSEEPQKTSREDRKKAKELEDARKAGTAPAEVDEEGKDINPHIPQYISTTPWYYNASGPTLKHQKVLDDQNKYNASLNEYYVRGLKGSTATKFRKGACENCGAMTHKKKDCLDRPRKVGAKYTGTDIAPDELLLPNLKYDYAGKRDRWNGFDPVMYKSVIEEHLKVEEAKQILKEEKLKQDLINTEGASDASDEEEDEKYADHIDMPGTKVDSKQRITVRNLRIREDTAKYLRNLDIDSAYYDPKTRSMRDNPYKHTGKSVEELQYAGDNFIRYMGETQKVSQAQLFAWEMAEKGIDIHLQAEPTKAEIIHKELDSKKNDLTETIKDSVLSKYGGKEYLEAPPKELIFSQTEDYVEYSRSGQIIKGQHRLPIRSNYKEDVYINRHTTVFGSYWNNGRWGYKCCHSFIKNSYCTGTLGKVANNPQNILSESHFAEDEPEEDQFEEEPATKSLLEQHIENKKKNKKNDPKKTTSTKSKDDNDDEIDQEKLKIALLEEEKNKKMAENILKMDDRKRSYYSQYDDGPITSEQMEAYQIKRQRDEDPMAAFIKK